MPVIVSGLPAVHVDPLNLPDDIRDDLETAGHRRLWCIGKSGAIIRQPDGE
jgi:hypothetical protein